MELGTTFVVAADHGVSRESSKLSIGTESETVSSPLQRADFVEDPARKDGRLAHDCRSVRRLNGELLSWLAAT